jgi:hypothetical protein
VKLILVPGRGCPLGEPDEEGDGERVDATETDDDEPAETLSESGLSAEEGAAAGVGLAKEVVVSARRWGVSASDDRMGAQADLI